MSALLGGTQFIGEEDRRLDQPGVRREADYLECVDATAPASFVSPWWPQGDGFCGDSGDASFGLLHAEQWSPFDPAGGASSRFGVTGITRDQYGSILGGVTVKLFRTGNDEKLDQTVSDAAGLYLLNTPYYPETHYLLFYKAGSPDVFGSSVNTLIGT